jgi:hypothetical protein
MSDDGICCPKCGAIMVRTGSCYTCPECGHNGGCGLTKILLALAVLLLAVATVLDAHAQGNTTKIRAVAVLPSTCFAGSATVAQDIVAKDQIVYVCGPLNDQWRAVAMVDDLSSYVPATRTVNGHALSANVTVTKGDVSLGNADNTSDANKPVSTATQTALNGKAALSHAHVLADVTDAGTAAAKNVAASGNAASGEVVKGSDTRLSDARTPTSHSHPESDVTNLTTDLAAKVAANGAITGATKTKITFDSKGLVASGADANTADVADSLDKRYVTDAQRTVITNTSGANTGDQDLSGYVTTSRTVNSHALSANVTVTKADVSLGNADNTSDANKPVSTATQTALNGKAALSHTHLLADVTDAGTAASKNVAASGNAASGEVVKGGDTRLTDARTPTSHSHPESDVTNLTTDLAGKVAANGAITGATKTKITYDAKGLVTGGADATTADVADSVDKRYVTDAQRTVITNTTGTNTGDQSLSALALKATTITAGAGLSGGGDLSANRTVATDSTEADFISQTAVTCGASTAGKAAVIADGFEYCDKSATPTLRKTPAGEAGAANNFLTAYDSAAGTFSKAQPSCSSLSNAAASCSTDATNASNIGSGTLPAARLPNPSSSTLGGVQSLASVASKWINTVSTAGVPSATQPAFSDLSGSATCAQMPALTGNVTTSAGNCATTLAAGSAANLDSGTLLAARMPALTGDVTTSAGAVATTLASVATAGTTGSSTAIPVITINVKGLTTSITTAAVIAPAGTLSGSTLASGVTASSLTSFGAQLKSVGSAPTCAFSTGGGTSPSCALETGSTDSTGTMTITTGSGSPGSAGTITLTFNATLGTNSPVCVASLTKGATDWSVSSTVRVTTQSTTAPVFTWNSQSATALVALTASTNYKISYLCYAK